MNLLKRKRSIRRVPLGMLVDPKNPRNVLNPMQAVADISPGSLLLLWASMHPVGGGTPFLFEMEFVPECPNPLPKPYMCSDRNQSYIPHEVWFAVDVMTCKRGFAGDNERFREIVSGHESLFEEIIASASNHVVECFAGLNADERPVESIEEDEVTTVTQAECASDKKPEKQTLTSVTKELALPTIVDHYIYRRVILWYYQECGSMKDTSERMGFAKGSSNLYVLCRPERLSLTAKDLKNPTKSSGVLEEEKEWLVG